MEISGQASRIQLANFSTPQMRAFHMSWIAFCTSCMAWFGIAPLMAVVREDLQLTQQQIGWCIVGSVSGTILARLFMGWLCDRIGSRLAHTGLLLLGAIPVIGIALADSYASFLMFRIAIGVIGASFVVTQFHTSVMFGPACVGTANATTAGWGNLGSGLSQWIMPMLLTLFVTGLGWTNAAGWRACMVAIGAALAVVGVLYYFLTQDAPEGNFAELRAAGKLPNRKASQGALRQVCTDYRVWTLFIIYAGCFGLELTIHNVAALYLIDHFSVFDSMEPVAAVRAAGFIAGLFGTMNLFARSLGGLISDRIGRRHGYSGRVKWLFVALLCEGTLLMLFSRMNRLAPAVAVLLLFAIFVQMSSGATFSIVPLIARRGLGTVVGIVGAGGNAGAVAAGFLFANAAMPWSSALFILGACATCVSFLCFALKPVDAEANAFSSMTPARSSGHAGEMAPASLS